VLVVRVLVPFEYSSVYAGYNCLNYSYTRAIGAGYLKAYSKHNVVL
jgi:hypothetical protein